MKKLLKGNEAIAEAAIQAGCRFFFGYPITPQNQIPEYMSKRMPQVGGCFLQAESEVAAINMVYGAAGAGARVMTSSSSPGISLKQEGISYIVGAELPCVIVNMVRGGPGLGSIQPAQSDYYQATRGGGHGDYRMCVLAPSSVQEAVTLTQEAFDIADRYRALIRETTGNYDFLQNDDLSQMKTATGLALLSERAESRALTKNADKYAAFARLLRLADYMALENFSYSKIVQIGAAPDTSMVYGFGDIAEMGYVPQLDVRVFTGGSSKNLRSYALSVLSDLLSADISETNYLFVKSIAELSDLPMRKEICDLLDAKFAPKKL